MTFAVQTEPVTISQICEGIALTLAQATGIAKVEYNDQITDMAGDLPLVKVFADSGEVAFNSSTDRTTFKGGMRVNSIIINALVYVKQRVSLGQDIHKTQIITEAIIAELSRQNEKPYFKVEGVKSFSYSWVNQIFPSNESGVEYIGVEFTFNVYVY